MDSIITLLLLPTYLVTLLAIFISIHLILQKRTATSAVAAAGGCPLPQAAGAWPLIGHLHLFIGKNQLAHKTLAAMADKCGESPVFAVKIGSHRALVVSSWEMAKECFTTHDRVFSTKPNLAASKLLGYDFAMFGFAPYSPYWRHIRRLTTTNLLSGHQIDLGEHVRVSEVQASVRELYRVWKGKANNVKVGNGVVVDMKQWFGDLTYNIALMTVARKRYYGVSSVTSNGEARRAQKALRNFTFLFGAFVMSDAIPSLGWIDVNGYQKLMKRTAGELDSLVSQWLDEHKEKKRSELSGNEELDFMDVMLRIMENEGSDVSGFDPDTVIKATCLNLIVAGTDTTVVTLIWALSLLLNNNHILKKVQHELDTQVGKKRLVEESDLENLPYLKAIVKETMRLYPPIPVIAVRAAMEDCTLTPPLSSGHGYHVPAGTRLMVNAWKIQRDKRVWGDNAEEFVSERFLTRHKDVDVKGHSFELIPFGSGRRVCPGALLGLRVVHFALARFLQCFEFAKVGVEELDMTESPGMTNLRASPLEVTVSPRLNSSFYEL